MAQYHDTGEELAHQREYENALAFMKVEGPSWDDLTEEQRECVRSENRQYWLESAKRLDDFIQRIEKKND